MTDGQRATTRAPLGDLATFAAGDYSADGATFRVFRKGTGPAVIVITEMPGISPMVLGFADRARVAGRCAAESFRVIGMRFKGDPFVPGDRFAMLRQRLGDGFVSIELEQSDGNPNGPLGHRHSVLTGDLIDEPGEPTREALDTVLDLFRTKLLPADV